MANIRLDERAVCYLHLNFTFPPFLCGLTRSPLALPQAMRGSPPLQLVLLTLAFALLTVPLARLTSASSVSARPASPQLVAKTIPVTLRLRTRDVPRSVSLKLAGQELLPPDLQHGAWPAKAEWDAQLAIPKEGVEFFLTATWPPGTPETAITLEVEPEGLDAQSQTRWSTEGQVSEALLFRW